MRANTSCEGSTARWRRASREWLGYDLAVWGEHGDDERNWNDVDDLHRSHGGSMETMPEELRAQPDRFRDPTTWCRAQPESPSRVRTRLDCERDARDRNRRECALHAKARASEDTRRIVMHLTRSLALCDHVGDVGNAVIDLWKALGMGAPPDDGDGIDIEAIEKLLGCKAGLRSADFDALAAKVREP